MLNVVLGPASTERVSSARNHPKLVYVVLANRHIWQHAAYAVAMLFRTVLATNSIFGKSCLDNIVFFYILDPTYHHPNEIMRITLHRRVNNNNINRKHTATSSSSTSRNMLLAKLPSSECVRINCAHPFRRKYFRSLAKQAHPVRTIDAINRYDFWSVHSPTQRCIRANC